MARVAHQGHQRRQRLPPIVMEDDSFVAGRRRHPERCQQAGGPRRRCLAPGNAIGRTGRVACTSRVGCIGRIGGHPRRRRAWRNGRPKQHARANELAGAEEQEQGQAQVREHRDDQHPRHRGRWLSPMLADSRDEHVHQQPAECEGAMLENRHGKWPLRRQAPIPPGDQPRPRRRPSRLEPHANCVIVHAIQVLRRPRRPWS